MISSTTHWEQRRQRGWLYRWDNAPRYPHMGTFPAHLHDGDETTIVESYESCARSSPAPGARFCPPAVDLTTAGVGPDFRLRIGEDFWCKLHLSKV